MKKLTKRFRVLHIEDSLLDDQIEFPKGTETYPPAEATAREFDFREEAEQYIIDNALIYESSNEEI